MSDGYVVTLQELLGGDRFSENIEINHVVELKLIAEIVAYAPAKGLVVDLSGVVFSESLTSNPYMIDLGFIKGAVPRELETLKETFEDRNSYLPRLNEREGVYELPIGNRVPRVVNTPVLVLTSLARFIIFNYVDGMGRGFDINKGVRPVEHDFQYLAALYFMTGIGLLKDYLDRYVKVFLKIEDIASFYWAALKAEFDLKNIEISKSSLKKRYLDQIKVGELYAIIQRTSTTTYADRLGRLNICRVSSKTKDSLAVNLIPHFDWVCTKEFLLERDMYTSREVIRGLNLREESYDIYSLGIYDAIEDSDKYALIPLSWLQSGGFQIVLDPSNKYKLLYMDPVTVLEGFFYSWGLDDMYVIYPEDVERYTLDLGVTGDEYKKQMLEFLIKREEETIFNP